MDFKISHEFFLTRRKAEKVVKFEWFEEKHITPQQMNSLDNI